MIGPIFGINSRRNCPFAGSDAVSESIQTSCRPSETLLFLRIAKVLEQCNVSWNVGISLACVITQIDGGCRFGAKMAGAFTMTLEKYE